MYASARITLIVLSLGVMPIQYKQRPNSNIHLLAENKSMRSFYGSFFLKDNVCLSPHNAHLI